MILPAYNLCTLRSPTHDDEQQHNQMAIRFRRLHHSSTNASAVAVGVVITRLLLLRCTLAIAENVERALLYHHGV